MDNQNSNVATWIEVSSDLTSEEHFCVYYLDDASQMLDGSQEPVAYIGQFENNVFPVHFICEKGTETYEQVSEFFDNFLSMVVRGEREPMVYLIHHATGTVSNLTAHVRLQYSPKGHSTK